MSKYTEGKKVYSFEHQMFNNLEMIEESLEEDYNGLTLEYDKSREEEEYYRFWDSRGSAEKGNIFEVGWRWVEDEEKEIQTKEYYCADITKDYKTVKVQILLDIINSMKKEGRKNIGVISPNHRKGRGDE